jgi:hypothetical protein
MEKCAMGLTWVIFVLFCFCFSDNTKSTGILNSFTKQTNALDVDKHMMKYIEEEMKKRKGEAGESEDSSKDQAREYHADTDILDELGIRVRSDLL